MRLHEIASTGFDEEKFERDCAYYLKQMGGRIDEGNWLWRGTTSKRLRVSGKNSWSPRRDSIDTPDTIHRMMNEYFDTHFGHPWRNGLFTSSTRRTAIGYGDPYVIVPIGEFEWLCNREFPDMYKHIASELSNSEGDDMETIAANLIEEMDGSRGWLHNIDLPACVDTNAEIILWCPGGYYAFDTEKGLPRAIS